MIVHRSTMFLAAVAFCVLIPAGPVRAQLNTQFNDIFQTILKDRMILSPGEHKNHYVDAATEADSLLVPALNGLIVSNLSSFPLSSTTPGVTFDFSGGELVSVQEGSGPVFADRATTIGKGKINFGFNATYLDMSRIRGLETTDMRFTFTHKDLNNDGLLGGADAEGATEADLVNVTMGMNLTAWIFAFYGTVGITKNLDLGVAVPIIHIHMSGTAHAEIASFTYANAGAASHFFGGTTFNPVLETDVPYDQSATGLGDIAVRLKYCFLRGGGTDFGALADVRIPTGKQENFFGSGKIDALIALLLSRKFGDFSPHLNLGYELRQADFQSDRVVLKGGFDHKVLQGLTFAADFLGTFDVDQSKAIKLFPGTKSIAEYGGNGGRVIIPFDLSNIPDRENDNLYNLSVGMKYSPWQGFLVIANILVPLNTGGLRASVAPTIGLSMNF